MLYSSAGAEKSTGKEQKERLPSPRAEHFRHVRGLHCFIACMLFTVLTVVLGKKRSAGQDCPRPLSPFPVFPEMKLTSSLNNGCALRLSRALGIGEGGLCRTLAYSKNLLR